MWMLASCRKFRLLAICNCDGECMEVNIVSLHDVIKKIGIHRVFGEESGLGHIIRLLIRERDLAPTIGPGEWPTTTGHATSGGGGGGVCNAGDGVCSPKYQLAFCDGYAHPCLPGGGQKL
jgi:hypothetical protein